MFLIFHTLEHSFVWTFHKPDKDYNESGLYDGTIIVVDLINHDKGDTNASRYHDIVRKIIEQWNSEVVRFICS